MTNRDTTEEQSVQALVGPQGSVWLLMNGAVPDHVGELVTMFDPNSYVPATEQLDAHYAHGGGWRPTKGHKLKFPDNGDWSFESFRLTYPNDPALAPMAVTFSNVLRQFILVFEYGWVCVVTEKAERGNAPFGAAGAALADHFTYEVARMD